MQLVFSDKEQHEFQTIYQAGQHCNNKYTQQ
jgi:hypothetical protein